ncbi:MAG TPA: hypothetical protein EYQ50_06355, partial [Verrucomicrobiales bacterium]|nr:hypothetical protein [Verrucomicrobiales bacterium]
QRVVRLEHSLTDDRWLLDTVVEQLELPPEQVYEMPDNYDYVDFHQIAALDIPTLRFTPWIPTVPLALAGNIARLLVIMLAGEVYGQKIGMKVHDWSGFVTFAIAITLILVLSRVIQEDAQPSTNVPDEKPA